MGKQWCYFLFMLWFTYLIISSVLLFTKGFLLTRLVQENNATCLSFAEIPCLHKDLTPVNVTNGHEEQCSKSDKLSYVLKNINSASSICLPRKSRIVLIVVDALRYDFTLFNGKLDLPRPYQNKLPVIDRLLKQSPKSNRLYKFIADPPTTTMQRIKGLTTGSLPTFIDASSNFATAEINEDNVIDQLLRNNMSAVFMGDDTWNGLYPDRFVRKYPYPSFNVWDLDTVDDGVRSHLYTELNNSDWSLLIAHFLGVDHCGHRYGPNHPEMTRKLTEINTVIENIVDDLDSDTMLFVIGDHGMTVSGDHGGASIDETTSALFVHSKTPLSSFLSQQTEHATVKQVSLVPTMSAILGVSVPFQNLGTLILDALPLPNDTKKTEEHWQSSLFSLWANAQQMMTYIEEYSKQSPDTFEAGTLKSLTEQFSILNSKALGVENETDFVEFAEGCIEFMTFLRNVCETVWVQYDSFSMTRGLLFLFLSMFFVYTITDGIPISRLPEIFMSSFLACSYAAMFVAAGMAVVLHHFGYVANLLSTVFFFTAMVSQVMLVMLVIQNWELISLSWHDRSQKERLPNLVCRFVLIFFLCGLFSNSFIVEESFVLLFSLNTVIVVGTLSVIETRKKSKQQQQHSSKFKLILTALGVLIMVRISVYFWKCREEQQWCFDALHGMTSKFETSKLQWTITVISMALFVTLTKVWLRNCGNMNGYSLTVTLAKFAPTVLVVCSSGFWVLNRLPSDTKNKLIGPWQANILAWIVYALAGLGIAVTAAKPLCVYILPSKKDPSTVEIEDGSSIIPQLFRKVKNLFNETGTEDVPVICGLGTVYSATFIIIGVYVVLFMALIHGDAVAPSTIVMFLAASFVLIITSIVRVEKATSIEQLLEIPNMSIFVWVILAQYFFYGTGHQPTFPNIPWEAAFVGTSGVFSSNFIPATLVVINTFSSYILMGFLLPLMLIMPFAVSIMIPTAIRKNNVLHKESLRGEVLLFERDGLMITSAFTTSCKYIMVHGIRVFASMLAATIHCRHLMVWKIFAPKMIFEALALCATLVAVNLGFLLLIRVNYQVDRLVASLNKKYS